MKIRQFSGPGKRLPIDGSKVVRVSWLARTDQVLPLCVCDVAMGMKIADVE
jgi:hypothetical protein